jgi:hypothetical protein
MAQYVQFSDTSQKLVISVFGNPQPDTDAYPNQGSVEDVDPRYLAFITPPAEPVVDPVDKLKEFLAANPDVAAILK